MPIVQQGGTNTTALVVPDLYVQIVPPPKLNVEWRTYQRRGSRRYRVLGTRRAPRYRRDNVGLCTKLRACDDPKA